MRGGPAFSPRGGTGPRDECTPGGRAGGPTTRGLRSPQALDDGGVRLATALAHGLESIAGAGAFHLVDQGGHEPGARAPRRVADGDGPAVDVDLGHVRMVLLLP